MIKVVVSPIFLNENAKLIINPSNKWLIGRPTAYAGLTGDKIIMGWALIMEVDSYVTVKNWKADDDLMKIVMKNFNFSPGHKIKSCLWKPIYAKLPNMSISEEWIQSLPGSSLKRSKIVKNTSQMAYLILNAWICLTAEYLNNISNEFHMCDSFNYFFWEWQMIALYNQIAMLVILRAIAFGIIKFVIYT